jgi:hypothetical protein
VRGEKVLQRARTAARCCTLRTTREDRAVYAESTRGFLGRPCWITVVSLFRSFTKDS